MRAAVAGEAVRAAVAGEAWRCLGVSEIVRDQEALFLEEFEPEVRVLDPRQTTLVRDTSSQHRASLLYIESLLRDVPPPTDGLYIGHQAAMDALDFQLDPAWMALQKPRQRILISDTIGLGKTLERRKMFGKLTYAWPRCPRPDESPVQPDAAGRQVRNAQLVHRLT